MSAQEFGEWQVFIKREQLHPGAMRLRYAQLQAVALQGASTRRDGKNWSAEHLLPPDPWAEPVKAAPRRVDVHRQVAALNARRRR